MSEQIPFPIGTVIYSIIAPITFLKQNPAWMLLDGCDPELSKYVYGEENAAIKKFRTSLLHAGGIDILPDGRGVFIRGMNLDRDISSGDPEGNKDVGRFQGDAVGPHRHKLPDNLLQRHENGVKLGANAPFMSTVTLSTEQNDGIETRPRNISLYLYVKVN